MTSHLLSDRFIPLRPENPELHSYLLTHGIEIGNKQDKKEHDKKEYDKYLTTLFQNMFLEEKPPNVLQFSQKKKYIPSNSSPRLKPIVPDLFPQCTKTFNAEDALDDFYAHPLSGFKDHFTVALSRNIYLQDLQNDKITKLTRIENEPVCIDLQAQHLNIGTENQKLSQLDLVKGDTKSSITLPHRPQVARQSEAVIYAGCYENGIVQWDTREKSLSRSYTHHGRVCNVAIQEHRIAAGLNENIVKVWDIRKSKDPYASFDQFTAGIKALQWHPNTTLIAGGGMHDKTIKFLNTEINKIISSIHTGLQVTTIQLNNEGTKLISTHGTQFQSPHYAVCKLWNIQQSTLTFQSSSQPQEKRFLHSTLAQNGQTFISATSEFVHVYENAFPFKKPTNTFSDPFTFDIR